MDIILLKDIEKVGDKHEVVTVKDGYARNFLIPKKMAIIANKPNMAKLDEIKRKEMEQLEKRLSEFQEIADKLKTKKLKIGAKAGQSGKIFGSVTNIQISNAINEQLNLDIDRKKIIVPEDIKELGTYKATLNLHPKVEAEVEFEVMAE